MWNNFFSFIIHQQKEDCQNTAGSLLIVKAFGFDHVDVLFSSQSYNLQESIYTLTWKVLETFWSHFLL